MFSQEKLKEFKAVKTENSEKLYQPGVWKDNRMIKFPVETKESLYGGIWAMPWPKMKKVFIPWENPKFERYHVPESMREWGKKEILGRLNIISTDSEVSSSPKEASSLQQPPTKWPFLAGFDEVPAGTVAPPGVPTAQRDPSGWLVSILKSGFEYVTDIEKAKLEIQKTEAEAKVEETKKATITQGNIPILALIGGGLLLFVLTKKKGGK